MKRCVSYDNNTNIIICNQLNYILCDPLTSQENFEGDSVRVPDLEGVLYQKESGKRKWNQRFFLLRASGIYYIPKGKNKVQSILYK